MCFLKTDVAGSSDNPCRNYRVVGGNRAPSTVKPWFPTNTHDADMIGTNKWKPEMDRMWTHGVNLGQAMATWSAMYRLTGDASYLAAGKAGWEKVYRYHGQASGVFTGDETLAGLPPARGAEPGPRICQPGGRIAFRPQKKYNLYFPYYATGCRNPTDTVPKYSTRAKHTPF